MPHELPCPPPFEYWRARCRVEEDGGCLIWDNGVQKENGRPIARYKTVAVSPQREVYKLAAQVKDGYVALPDRWLIYLTCRNPRCMTAEHMIALPWARYWRRLSSDGTLKRGPMFAAKGRANALKRSDCKLRSIDDARAIRAAVANDECKNQVAQRYGITRGYVQKIVNGRSWRESTPWGVI